MPLIRTPAWRIPLLLAGLWLIVFSATRLTLLLSHWQAAEPSLGALVRLFGVGFLYDLGFLAYALLPLSLACAVLPNKVWSSKLASPLLHHLWFHLRDPGTHEWSGFLVMATGDFLGSVVVFYTLKLALHLWMPPRTAGTLPPH